MNLLLPIYIWPIYRLLNEESRKGSDTFTGGSSGRKAVTTRRRGAGGQAASLASQTQEAGEQEGPPFTICFPLEHDPIMILRAWGGTLGLVSRCTSREHNVCP